MSRLMLIGFIALLLNPAGAFAGTAVSLYKSPTCECCNKYVQYLEKNGYSVKAINEGNMDAVKKRYGSARFDGN